MASGMSARRALSLAPPPTSAPRLATAAYGRQVISEEDLAAVVAALRGELLTCGPQVDAFEAELAAWLGAPHVAVCSSGTAALHLAYAALGLGPGDEIITSPITFSATASAAYQVGATVRFADVDPVTGNLAPAAVAELVGPRTRAVVAVHLAGQPAELDELAALCAREGLLLIEDACHALGATYRGRLVASGQADAAVLSFHPVKHITPGEGGAVIFRDAAHDRRARRLRHHGIERDPARLSRPAPGPWYHEVVEQGFNYRLSDLACALGRAQLTRLSAFLTRRRALAAAYRAALAACPELDPAWLQPPIELSDRESAYHLFAIALDHRRLGLDRGRLMTALAARGVGTQVHYIPLHHQPFHRRRAGRDADRPRPGAETYYARTLSLPMHPGLDEVDAVAVVDALSASITELRR